mmetsp:Transcript_1300/g.2122  ORF Transcript_1300/g.2122 Transcript_1300/m.2122 type:complete len:463 (+) Transcript_1300:78-1466(+)
MCTFKMSSKAKGKLPLLFALVYCLSFNILPSVAMSDPPQSSRSNVEPRDKERKLVNDTAPTNPPSNRPSLPPTRQPTNQPTNPPLGPPTNPPASDEPSQKPSSGPTEVPTDELIRILGLFDTDNWDWGEELFDYTMSMINDSNDGWQDDILGNGTYLEWDVKNSACDGTTALRAYWADRTDNNDVPPHGLLGCRCSAASISSANLAGLDGVTQVSPASTAKELSDKSEYPFFARTVASNQFSAKAIVATFRGFSWDRVSILQTDTVFSTGLSTDFQQLWTGEHDDESGVWEGDIAYSHSIMINQDETVNEESVRRALNGVPTDDPINNSRVILLIAHDQHAFSVLKTATEMTFQPDTIWIGVDAWSNQYPSNMEDFMSGFPVDAHPGYLGITPYQPNDDHLNFLSTLQEAQRRDGKIPWPELPHYAAAQMVDSIQALVMALVATPSKDRRNGTAVMSHVSHK